MTTWIRFFVNSLPGLIGIKIRQTWLTPQFQRSGNHIVLLRNFRVNNPKYLSIGNNFIANENCYLNAGGGIIIGDDVMLGPDVKIWSVNHSFSSNTKPFNQQGYQYKKVVIGNNVWIGANVFVAPGVTICDNVVIAAGAVVTKSILSPFCMAAGNPATIIKKF